MAMANEQGWRGVLVAPPNMLAGIGSALRHAFLVDAVSRSLDAFAELLARLDRIGVPGDERRRPRFRSDRATRRRRSAGVRRALG